MRGRSVPQGGCHSWGDEIIGVYEELAWACAISTRHTVRDRTRGPAAPPAPRHAATGAHRRAARPGVGTEAAMPRRPASALPSRSGTGPMVGRRGRGRVRRVATQLRSSAQMGGPALLRMFTRPTQPDSRRRTGVTVQAGRRRRGLRLLMQCEDQAKQRDDQARHDGEGHRDSNKDHRSDGSHQRGMRTHGRDSRGQWAEASN